MMEYEARVARVEKLGLIISTVLTTTGMYGLMALTYYYPFLTLLIVGVPVAFIGLVVMVRHIRARRRL